MGPARIPTYGSSGIKLPLLCLAFVGLQDARSICRGYPPFVSVQVLADGVDSEVGVEHMYCTKFLYNSHTIQYDFLANQVPILVIS
jgi:hypothetical protein